MIGVALSGADGRWRAGDLTEGGLRRLFGDHPVRAGSVTNPEVTSLPERIPVRVRQVPRPPT
jgi:hypothetical protein